MLTSSEVSPRIHIFNIFRNKKCLTTISAWIFTFCKHSHDIISVWRLELVFCIYGHRSAMGRIKCVTVFVWTGLDGLSLVSCLRLSFSWSLFFWSLFPLFHFRWPLASWCHYHLSSGGVSYSASSVSLTLYRVKIIVKCLQANTQKLHCVCSLSESQISR